MQNNPIIWGFDIRFLRWNQLKAFKHALRAQSCLVEFEIFENKTGRNAVALEKKEKIISNIMLHAVHQWSQL